MAVSDLKVEARNCIAVEVSMIRQIHVMLFCLACRRSSFVARISWVRVLPESGIICLALSGEDSPKKAAATEKIHALHEIMEPTEVASMILLS